MGTEGAHMMLINTPLSLEQVKGLERAARLTGHTRTEIIQLAVDSYLQDFDDQQATLDRIHNNPASLDIDWDEVATYFRD
jgi:hypothetical protein